MMSELLLTSLMVTTSSPFIFLTVRYSFMWIFRHWAWCLFKASYPYLFLIMSYGWVSTFVNYNWEILSRFLIIWSINSASFSKCYFILASFIWRSIISNIISLHLFISILVYKQSFSDTMVSSYSISISLYFFKKSFVGSINNSSLCSNRA